MTGRSAWRSPTRWVPRESFGVEPAEDGATADAVLRSTAYDLLILDIGLPQLGGRDLPRTRPAVDRAARNGDTATMLFVWSAA
jgi:DNA-binding response OmpR family regulator